MQTSELHPDTCDRIGPKSGDVSFGVIGKFGLIQGFRPERFLAHIDQFVLVSFMHPGGLAHPGLELAYPALLLDLSCWPTRFHTMISSYLTALLGTRPLLIWSIRAALCANK